MIGQSKLKSKALYLDEREVQNITIPENIIDMDEETKLISDAPQESCILQKQNKSERSLLSWYIYVFLGFGLLLLVSTFVLALDRPCGDFPVNIEPKNNAGNPAGNPKINRN